jgi:hypothetical protein
MQNWDLIFIRVSKETDCQIRIIAGELNKGEPYSVSRTQGTPWIVQ